MNLHILWFILLGLLLAGYAVLDGFDLGVGILHPLARGDKERRIFINAIGPIWDGNEVWLVTFGGALFAAFPEAYATVFSGFYTALMLVLLALILRAVSIEFRSKVHSEAWRKTFDATFFLSSFFASFLFGVAVGNAMMGIPLDSRGIYNGGFLRLVRPYPVLIGALTVTLFAMHGALFLFLKVPRGELHERLREWLWHTWGVFLFVFLLTTIFTLVSVPRAVPNFEAAPWAALLILALVLAVSNIPRALHLDRPVLAFVSSCVIVLSLVGLLGMTLWPNLVTASNDPEHSITIFRAASSPTTLKIMAIIAGCGMPLVLTYTLLIYWTFRKRVELGEHSY